MVNYAPFTATPEVFNTMILKFGKHRKKTNRWFNRLLFGYIVYVRIASRRATGSTKTTRHKNYTLLKD